MTFTIDTDSPEAGWHPFMSWLRVQGLDPRHTRAVTIDPDAMTATVTVFMTRDGKHYVVDDELAIDVHMTVPISSLPPRLVEAR